MKLKWPQKNPKKQVRILEGGGRNFLGGQNIYPWLPKHLAAGLRMSACWWTCTGSTPWTRTSHREHADYFPIFKALNDLSKDCFVRPSVLAVRSKSTVSFIRALLIFRESLLFKHELLLLQITLYVLTHVSSPLRWLAYQNHGTYGMQLGTYYNNFLHFPMNQFPVGSDDFA